MPLIPIAKLINLHGIKGELKAKIYTDDPISLLKSSVAFYDLNQQSLNIAFRQFKNDILIARLPHINNYNEAQQLLGTEIFVKREELPEENIKDDEFYIYDLLNLTVIDSSNCEVLGKVKEIENYGAGNIIVIITSAGEEQMYIFCDENFPEINLKENYIKLSIPSEI